MKQPRENAKNPNFGPNLGPPNFFSWILFLLVVRKCSKQAFIQALLSTVIFFPKIEFFNCLLSQ